MNHTLLIVTDLGGLNAYRPDTTERGTPRLELLEQVRLENARRRVVEQVTDQAGRRAAPRQNNGSPPVAPYRVTCAPGNRGRRARIRLGATGPRRDRRR
jgi:hypothetical protein